MSAPFHRSERGQCQVSECRISKIDANVAALQPLQTLTEAEPDERCTYTGCVWEPSRVMTPSLSISICLNVLTFCRISSSVYLNDKHESPKVKCHSQIHETKTNINLFGALKFKRVMCLCWSPVSTTNCIKREWTVQFHTGGHRSRTKNRQTIVQPAGKLATKAPKLTF